MANGQQSTVNGRGTRANSQQSRVNGQRSCKVWRPEGAERPKGLGRPVSVGPIAAFRVTMLAHLRPTAYALRLASRPTFQLPAPLVTILRS